MLQQSRERLASDSSCLFWLVRLGTDRFGVVTTGVVCGAREHKAGEAQRSHSKEGATLAVAKAPHLCGKYRFSLRERFADLYKHVFKQLCVILYLVIKYLSKHLARKLGRVMDSSYRRSMSSARPGSNIIL